MPLVTVVDSGEGQHHCLDSRGQGRSAFWGLTERREFARGGGVCMQVCVLKGSDYVIYSQRLAQLQESDPLHASLSLARCGMWSFGASRW